MSVFDRIVEGCSLAIRSVDAAENEPSKDAGWFSAVSTNFHQVFIKSIGF